MTTGISDAELTALIAGLQPAAVTEAQLGPWFPCQRPGRCAGCGAGFEEFEFIRADGEGGWLAECCSPRHHDPVGGIVAEPVPPAGPPPSTVRELRQVLIDFEAQRPRTMQRELGPSELGTPCQQEIARKLAGAPRRPITEPTWAPWQGTAVHASMEDVVAFWNTQLGRERWLAEDRLTVVEAAPAAIEGRSGYPAVEGNGDAFDTDHDQVVDWKHVGTTALDKLRAGKRLGKHPAEQISPTYRVQGHLYGLGHANKGRKVRWVRLVLLARSWRYDDSDEWTEEYREDIALTAINRYWSIVDLVHDLGGPNAGDLIAAVPSAPGKDVCKWCPFYRPGQATDWSGCAGDRPPTAHLARATAGLIEDSGTQPATPANGAAQPHNTKENQ